ncbi:hypothetical protein PRIPAC_78046 [Pristionchus pacificus]|uniref:Uncharacterized protein n=1 Tax=Pristionchus pacificus TaxID=54126 RepID=A0A2A6BXX8_PRIPA|nr:hypothetical protein PRIPAC_78046 [Pristionchus pacificus]|eukprot:PDM70621.1 hypothetical protein PRIPAC_46867 [Pristionchus pacificus]
MSQADDSDDDDIFYIYEEEEYSESSSDSDVDVVTCEESTSHPPSHEPKNGESPPKATFRSISTFKRPSWIIMIAQALKATKSGELHVTKIYECIGNRYFPSCKFKRTWKAIIRTTLSRSRFFENVEGGAHRRTAKVWRIRPDMMAKIDKRIAKLNGMKTREIAMDSEAEKPSCSFSVEISDGPSTTALIDYSPPSTSTPIPDHNSQYGRAQSGRAHSPTIKLPWSFASMITFALREHGQLPISKIFKFISNKFPNYCNEKYSTWKLKVSKVLVQNRNFMHIENGTQWQIRPDRISRAQSELNNQFNLDRQVEKFLNLKSESDKAKTAQKSINVINPILPATPDAPLPESAANQAAESALPKQSLNIIDKGPQSSSETSETGMLTAAHICEFICHRFPYYREATFAWRRSVRHELWNNRSFVCYGSDAKGQERNKNAKWQIRPENSVGNATTTPVQPASDTEILYSFPDDIAVVVEEVCDAAPQTPITTHHRLNQHTSTHTRPMFAPMSNRASIVKRNSLNWTFSNMVALSLEESPTGHLPTSEIYKFVNERFLIYNFDLKKAIRVALDDKSKFDYQVLRTKRGFEATWYIPPKNSEKVKAELAAQLEKDRQYEMDKAVVQDNDE